MACRLRVMLAVPHPRIFVIIFLIIMPIMCICGLAKHFCRSCREQEQHPPTAHLGPPELLPSAPAERIEVSTSEPPPPYSEVGVCPKPCSAPRPSASPIVSIFRAAVRVGGLLAPWGCSAAALAHPFPWCTAGIWVATAAARP